MQTMFQIYNSFLQLQIKSDLHDFSMYICLQFQLVHYLIFAFIIVLYFYKYSALQFKLCLVYIFLLFRLYISSDHLFVYPYRRYKIIFTLNAFSIPIYLFKKMKFILRNLLVFFFIIPTTLLTRYFV